MRAGFVLGWDEAKGQGWMHVRDLFENHGNSFDMLNR